MDFSAPCKQCRGRGKFPGGPAFAYPNEWADAPLLFLRRAGLVESRAKAADGSRIHKITDAGRAALARIGGE